MKFFLIFHKETILHIAAKKKYMDVYQVILKHGKTDKNTKDSVNTQFNNDSIIIS